ncbi:unnamed protein product [Boreogadus saida]
MGHLCRPPTVQQRCADIEQQLPTERALHRELPDRSAPPGANAGSRSEFQSGPHANRLLSPGRIHRVHHLELILACLSSRSLRRPVFLISVSFSHSAGSLIHDDTRPRQQEQGRAVSPRQADPE